MGKQRLLGYLSVIFLISNVAKVNKMCKSILEKFLKPRYISLIIELLDSLNSVAQIKVL